MINFNQKLSCFVYKASDTNLFKITQTRYCETACWRYETYIKFYFLARFTYQHLYFRNKPDAFIRLLATQYLRNVQDVGSVQKHNFAFTIVTDGCRFYVVQCVT